MRIVWFGQFAVSAFFAIAFLQSAIDKWVDRKGNLSYFGSHFANSPLRSLVPAMFWAITLLETIAGVLTAIGAVVILFDGSTDLALWGLMFSILSLLCLFFGQRLAKDYGGSVVIATYFSAALLGIVILQ